MLNRTLCGRNPLTYTQVWNADGDRVQNDVEEGNETSNPEGKDQ